MNVQIATIMKWPRSGRGLAAGRRYCCCRDAPSHSLEKQIKKKSFSRNSAALNGTAEATASRNCIGVRLTSNYRFCVQTFDSAFLARKSSLLSCSGPV